VLYQFAGCLPQDCSPLGTEKATSSMFCSTVLKGIKSASGAGHHGAWVAWPMGGQLRAGGNIPARSETADKVKAFQSGRVDYVTKPNSKKCRPALPAFFSAFSPV
jgi:hypothetical protein